MSFLSNLRFKLFIFGLALIVTAGLFQYVDAPARSQVLSLETATIVIDPGHGGIDPGCHRDAIFEKDIVLAVGLELAQALKTRGAHVILTREADIELSHLTDQEPTRHRRDLRARVNLADEVDGDFMVSLHVNTAASAQLGGAMVFFHPSSHTGKTLADTLAEELVHVVPGNQNGTLPANFFILRHTTMPSVLVEVGFLSNPTDRAILTSPQGQQSIVAALVDGIEQFWLRGTDNDPQDETNPTWVVPLPLIDEPPCFAGGSVGGV